MNKKKRVGVVILFANIFLTLVKFVAWFITGSVAVKSDGFNSLVDSVYSVVIITGFLVSNRERTSEYPEGLVRLEPFVSVFVAIMILLTAFKIAFDGVMILMGGNYSTPVFGAVATVALLLSIVIKLSLYFYVSEKADDYNSPSLAATAVDSRNDVIISFTAISGVFGSFVGFPNIEGLSAIIISLYVGYSGLKVAEENVEYALGASVSDEVRENIVEAAKSHDKVKGVHDVNVHYTGPLIDVSMHLEIPGELTIEEGHNIEVSVADDIREATSEDVNEINIHLDPYTLDEWETESG